MPFYEILIGGLRERGYDVETLALNRARVMHEIEGDRAFHIVNHGRVCHSRALNAGVAYIYPFWNMDPTGIRAYSSIADRKFKADAIDPEQARPFFRALRKRQVGARRSRYEQPQDRTLFLKDPVAVFLQSESHRGVDETCHLSQHDMLETVLQTVPGEVVVKPHPLEKDKSVLQQLSELKEKHPNLTVSDCNIHDLLAAASRVVTINSAVGIEAYLHRKPVILCGRADFQHIAETARNRSELAQYLRSEPRKRAYDKFMFWYFAQNCLSTTEPDLIDRFLARAGESA